MEIAGARCRVDGDLAGDVVVLLHGFGAPGDDLVGLAPALRQKAGGALDATSFVFPEAPVELGPEFFGGRAWWWIDMAGREARMRDPSRTWEETVPDGLAAARAQVEALLDALEARGVGPGRVVLGGFSQGAMLTVDVALRRATPPRALVLLSGAVVAAHARCSRDALRTFRDDAPGRLHAEAGAGLQALR